MIVSEQDSETSLNRRKPRPPADAAWIWIDLLIGMFQEHWTVLAHLTREFHPLRFSQVAPFACDGPHRRNGLRQFVSACGENSLTPSFLLFPQNQRFCGNPTRCFNARTEAGQSYLPDIRVIAPDQPRSVCARKAAPPIPPFSSWDRGLLNPARLSFRAHIGCIQCTYSIFKLSPDRTDAPFPIHSCRMASVEMCLKLSRISRREQKRKAAERRLSLSIRFSDMRPSCQ